MDSTTSANVLADLGWKELPKRALRWALVHAGFNRAQRRAFKYRKQ